MPSRFAASDVVPFVHAIVGCAPAHFIETRIIRGDTIERAHFAQHDRALIDHLRKANELRCNIYFGVAPRTAMGRGDRQHCAGLGCLYCDIDFKLRPEDIAREVLLGFCLPPSAVVETGGGLHSYWLLSEFLDFPEHFEQARSLLRRLCITLGADIAAAEPVRILRVPGSFNSKYDPPRPVRIAAFDPAIRYDIADFEDVLCNVEDARGLRAVEGKEPTVARPFSGRTSAWARKVIDAELERLAAAANGTRNATLASVAFKLGQLVAGGEADAGELRAHLRAIADCWADERSKSADTIARAFDEGMAHPRRRPQRQPKSRRSRLAYTPGLAGEYEEEVAADG